jgi:hypothetical protein
LDTCFRGTEVLDSGEIGEKAIFYARNQQSAFSQTYAAPVMTPKMLDYWPGA